MIYLQTLLEKYPFLDSLLVSLAISLAMLALFTVSCVGFLVFALQWKSAKTKRGAYNKCARQVDTIGLLVGWILIVSSRLFMYMNIDSFVPNSSLALIVDTSWTALAVAVCVLTLHFSLWKVFAEHRYLHSFLALLSGICGFLALIAVTAALRMVSAMDLPNAAVLPLEDLYNFQIFPSPLLKATLVIIPLAFTLSSAVALVWLLLRRNRDDFGRDYYNTMLPWCARWAFIACNIVTLVCLISATSEVWGRMALANLSPTLSDLFSYCCRILPPLFASLLWGVAAYSDTPLRHKPAIWLALFASIPSGYYFFTDITSFVF